VHRTRKFTVVLEPEEEGGVTVRVPSLPEIVTYGRDEAEALAMAEDAIRLVLEDSLARGEPLPNASPHGFARLQSRSLHERTVAGTQGEGCHPCARNLLNLGQPLQAHSCKRSTRRVAVPLHGSTDLKRGTLRGIINQAGLTVAQFIALL
jgi:antitoxin HicB